MTDDQEVPAPSEPIPADPTPTAPVEPVSPKPPAPAPVPDVQPPTGAVTEEADIDEEHDKGTATEPDLVLVYTEQVEPEDIPNGGTE